MNATFFEAAVILLREGLEGPSSCSRHSPPTSAAPVQQDRLKALWAGAGAAVLASIFAAWMFELFNNGVHNDIFEGVVIFLAAALLFYVSGWLFLKQDPKAWQAYLKTQTDKALIAGSGYVVASLAFLAVLREGGETALFLHVLAKGNGGWTASLVGGILVAFACLGVLCLDHRQYHAAAASARRVPGHLAVPVPDGAQVRRRGPAGVPGAGARALRHGARRRLAHGARPQSDVGGARRPGRRGGARHRGHAAGR